MENIFEIKFTFEKKCRDKVITKFSNKQGGDFNVFSFHWQCFVWAAIIGFLRGERRELSSPLADKVFSLSTMSNNGGEKDAQALICLAIAKAGTLDIMKNPHEAIKLVNEYANGGFYHIMKLIENGETSFNDLEQVKQEIFTRDYQMLDSEDKVVVVETDNDAEIEDIASETQNEFEDDKELDFTIENTAVRCSIKDRKGNRVFVDEGKLKVINGTPYRFNRKCECLTVKCVQRYGDKWMKGGKLLVAYNGTELYEVLKDDNYIENIEDFQVNPNRSENRLKVNGVWFDFYGRIVPAGLDGLVEQTTNDNTTIVNQDTPLSSYDETKKRRWGTKEKKELAEFFKQGMSIEQLCVYFNRESDDISDVLRKLKLI